MKNAVLLPTVLFSLALFSSEVRAYGLTCGPKIESGRLDFTKRMLHELLQREEFHGTNTLPKLENRVAYYQKILGIQNIEQYVEFLETQSHRDRIPYIDHAMANLQLSRIQAELLVNGLVETLDDTLRWVCCTAIHCGLNF